VEAPVAFLALTESLEGIAVEMPGGGQTTTLDPTQPLAIRLAGMPRDHANEIRVCTFGASSVHEPSRLTRLHELGWSGRTRCFVVFDPIRGWVVQDSQSTVAIQVNGQHVGEHILVQGDRIEPARGLTFTFMLASE
jgi:hypothetical protein